MNADYGDKKPRRVGRDVRRQTFIATGRLSPYLRHLCNLRSVSFLHGERFSEKIALDRGPAVRYAQQQTVNAVFGNVTTALLLLGLGRNHGEGSLTSW